MTETLHLRLPTCNPPFAFGHATSNSVAAFSDKPQLAPPPGIGPVTPSLTSHSCALACRLARHDATTIVDSAADFVLLQRVKIRFNLMSPDVISELPIESRLRAICLSPLLTHVVILND